MSVLRVLGVDLSGHSCGWALLTGKELTASGTIIPKPQDYWQRQEEIVTHLETTIESGEPVNKVVFERVRLFHGGKISLAAIEDLARLSGAIGLIALRRGIVVESVHTNHYRRRVLGDGKATKQDVVKWVESKYKVKTKTTDQAEAIAIGYFGTLTNGNGNGTGKTKGKAAGTK